MLLAEDEQEIGQLRVSGGVARGQQHVAQLAAGGEHLPQAADIVLAAGEGPARRADRGWHPAREEVAAPLAQFAPEVGQQFHRPHQRPPDPASQHAPVDVHRVVVEPGFQRRQREPLGDEHADRGKDLAEGRGLVGHVRAGEDAREAAVTAGQLLDPDGMLAIPRGTAAPAVSPKRADAGHDDGVNQPDPAGYLRFG